MSVQNHERLVSCRSGCCPRVESVQGYSVLCCDVMCCDASSAARLLAAVQKQSCLASVCITDEAVRSSTKEPGGTGGAREASSLQDDAASLQESAEGSAFGSSFQGQPSQHEADGDSLTSHLGPALGMIGGTPEPHASVLQPDVFSFMSLTSHLGFDKKLQESQSLFCLGRFHLCLPSAWCLLQVGLSSTAW